MSRTSRVSAHLRSLSAQLLHDVCSQRLSRSPLPPSLLQYLQLATAAQPQATSIRSPQFGDVWSNALQSAVVPSVTQHLQQRGWAAVENAVNAQSCRALRAELKALRQQGHMKLNCTHLVRSDSRALLEKSNIWEADMLLPDVRNAAALCKEMLQDTNLQTLLSIYLGHLRLDAQTMKLQINDGNGGCFPIHHDSDESVDARRMTAILYLNEGWQPEHGGKLRLYPLRSSPVDIPPKAGTLVLFSSCRMLHRVMPSSVERHCITLWLFQSRMGSAPMPLGRILRDLEAKGGITDHDSLQRLLEEPEVCKHLGKLAHAEEWAESLTQSHPATDQRTACLDTFWQEVSALRTAFDKVLPGGVENLLKQLIESRQAGQHPAYASAI